MKRLFLLMLFVPMLLIGSEEELTEECISFKNRDTKFINGELITVSRQMFVGHGPISYSYLFKMDEEACFYDGTGNLTNKIESCKNGDQWISPNNKTAESICLVKYEIQVLLSEDQKNNLESLQNKKLEMKVTWITWGGTQHWLREVGVKGEFKVLN